MRRIIPVTLFLMLAGQNVLAYLDPGTGSMLFQVLIAGGLASVYLLKTEIKTIWQKMSDFIKKRE